MKRLFNFALDGLYFFVLGVKYFYIYTHNSFTWFYNQLSRLFGWNRRFYYAQEKPDKETLSQKIIGWFRWNKKPKGTDYQQKYEEAKAQSDRNFKRYQSRKTQSDKNYSLYKSCKKKADALEVEKQKYQKTVQDLENQLAQARQNKSTNQSQTKKNDNRSDVAIFGLTTGFTQQALKDSYQRLTSRYHPDKHAHMSPAYIDEATEEFKKIQSAYKNLKTKN